MEHAREKKKKNELPWTHTGHTRTRTHAHLHTCPKTTSCTVRLLIVTESNALPVGGIKLECVLNPPNWFIVNVVDIIFAITMALCEKVREMAILVT